MTTFLTILLGVLLFGLLIAVHEFGHFFTAKLCGVRVNEFAIGMGPKLLSHQGKETLYSLRLFPIGGYCAMEGEDEDTEDPRSFQKAAAWKKFIILVAGAFMNFVVGFLLFFILSVSMPAYNTPTVADLLPDYVPQSEVGLQPGDTILEVDGHAIYLSSDIQLFFQRGGDTLDLTVRRNGEKVHLGPCYMPYYQNSEGQRVRGIQLGVAHTTFLGAVQQGWLQSIDTVRLVWISLGDLFTGAVGIRDMSGPVGIVSVMGDMAAQSESTLEATLNIVYLIAFIAVNLAVMNLLPIPALDGGRVFFLLVNVIYTFFTKKNLNPKYEGIVNTVGLVLLLGLMVVVAASDVLKLFGR